MSELTNQLEPHLTQLARSVIVERLGGMGLTADFLADPDAPEQHEPRWHEFGIVTHQQRAAAAYEDEVPNMLNEWGVEDKVRRI